MIPARRFVILDRDGTINVERRYLSDPAKLALLPGVAPGLRTLREIGLGLIVVTNQSGIARGFFNHARLERVHDRLHELLGAVGVELDGVYVCPHGPDDGCPCRKPRDGLVVTAARELGFQPERSFVIGDKPCDIELGQRIGATTLLVRTGYGAETAASLSDGGGTVPRPDLIVADLKAAASAIRKRLGNDRSGGTSSRHAA